MHRQLYLFFALWAALLFTGQVSGKVRLPILVGDSMVLQRDAPLTVWGWADEGEKVTVRFLKQSVSTKTGNDGKWHLTLAPIAPHTGGGLVSKDKYGYVKGFALAGTDKKFFWAKAYVENKTTLVVYSDEVANPVAIRYGWADNPDDANLYNAEGLPASPFRTDSW